MLISLINKCPSRDRRENPFFNCHGFKPVVIEKRFGMIARLAPEINSG